MSDRTDLDGAVVTAFPYLVAGLLVSPLLLAVPSSWSLTARFLVHLALLVGLAVGLVGALAPLGRPPWFATTGWSEARRRFATDVSIVVMVTGVVGLVTLASSAALRFQPSVQFLQLLSALDIAWAASAVAVGAGRLWGRRASWMGGVVIGVACVASIWNYLRVVGFAPDGTWALRGSELVRLVLPADTVAAVVAIVILVLGARRTVPA